MPRFQARISMETWGHVSVEAPDIETARRRIHATEVQLTFPADIDATLMEGTVTPTVEAITEEG